MEEMDETILGSAYTNPASCLTMLYRMRKPKRLGTPHSNIPSSQAPLPPVRFSMPRWAMRKNAKLI